MYPKNVKIRIRTNGKYISREDTFYKVMLSETRPRTCMMYVLHIMCNISARNEICSWILILEESRICYRARMLNI